MAGTRAGDGGAPGAWQRLVGSGLDAHAVLPVHPVAVAYQQRDRAAERFTTPNARQNLCAVLFDRHAASAAVTELPSRQIDSDLVGRDAQPRRHTLDDHDERLAVRFTCCEKPQH